MSRVPLAHQAIRASAGSGKTHQLTNRYLRLLAQGVEPDANAPKIGIY
jgi:ATP-dependent exoDNAse (exonuclease V) beta subunit